MAKIDDQLEAWIRQRDIGEIEALVPDVAGKARGKIIPADRFVRGEGVRLPEAVFMQTVTGDWPEQAVYEALMHPSDRDMFLRPDPDTVCVVPWVEEPTAQVINDCVDVDGKLHPLASRTVLQRVLERFREEGLEPVIAPELEFYLVEKNTDADYPLRPPVGRSGRPERARQSYSIDAVNEFDPLFEEMYDYADLMELDLDTLIHESGAAQMEVNFEHGDALSRADQIFLFKRMMREVAMRHDVFATFLAKPMENEPGSSMHIHQSLNSTKTGKNVFDEGTGELNDMFRHYIGGLQTYTPAAMVFYGPYVNSYRRFVYGDSAPTNVQWGLDNRTAGLRVPVSASANRRIESRFAGSDVNPYLAIAAALASGYLGLKQQLEPTEPTDQNAREMARTLPLTMEHALIALEQEPDFRVLMGEEMCIGYAGIKRAEYAAFFSVISSWEREFLLLNV